MAINTTLRQGNKGEQVKELQQMLNANGYNLSVDGDFGPLTAAAVKAYQSSKGLSVDGIVGPQTTSSFYSPSTSRDPLSFGNNQSILNYGDTYQGQPVKFDSQTGKPLQPGQSTYASPEIAKEIDDYVNQVMESVINSGKVINPNITDEYLAQLDPAKFLAQAEASIAPEYKGKFDSIKESLSRTLSNLGYDLTLKKEGTQREYKETLESGTEDLAGRGLTFSSNRNNFNADLASARDRELTAADEAAQRFGQQSFSEAESKIGTENLRSSGLPSSIGGRSLAFSGTPQTGSLVSDQQYLKESMARELEKQARQRSAYARSGIITA